MGVGGRKRVWWFDPAGNPVVASSPIVDRDEAQEAILEQIEPSEEKFEFFAVMGELTPKQRFVIERRYGFFDGFEYTLKEIAASMGVSFQAVQQIQMQALEKLRKWA